MRPVEAAAVKNRARPCREVIVGRDVRKHAGAVAQDRMFGHHAARRLPDRQTIVAVRIVGAGEAIAQRHEGDQAAQDHEEHRADPGARRPGREAAGAEHQENRDERQKRAA